MLLKSLFSSAPIIHLILTIILILAFSLIYVTYVW